MRRAVNAANVKSKSKPSTQSGNRQSRKAKRSNTGGSRQKDRCCGMDSTHGYLASLTAHAEVTDMEDGRRTPYLRHYTTLTLFSRQNQRCKEGPQHARWPTWSTAKR